MVNDDGIGECIRKFLKDIFDMSSKDWCEKKGKLDARVYFYTGKKNDKAEETLPIVSVEKASHIHSISLIASALHLFSYCFDSLKVPPSFCTFQKYDDPHVTQDLLSLL